jgi:hypothetical protein
MGWVLAFLVMTVFAKTTSEVKLEAAMHAASKKYVTSSVTTQIQAEQLPDVMERFVKDPNSSTLEVDEAALQDFFSFLPQQSPFTHPIILLRITLAKNCTNCSATALKVESTIQNWLSLRGFAVRVVKASEAKLAAMADARSRVLFGQKTIHPQVWSILEVVLASVPNDDQLNGDTEESLVNVELDWFVLPQQSFHAARDVPLKIAQDPGLAALLTDAVIDLTEQKKVAAVAGNSLLSRFFVQGLGPFTGMQLLKAKAQASSLLGDNGSVIESSIRSQKVVLEVTYKNSQITKEQVLQALASGAQNSNLLWSISEDSRR